VVESTESTLRAWGCGRRIDVDAEEEGDAGDAPTPVSGRRSR
jgi:hypothetical protein